MVIRVTILAAAVWWLLPVGVGVCANVQPTVPLEVVGWNIESGGADLGFVTKRIAAFDGVDLWGISEVESLPAAEALRSAAGVGEGGPFELVLGESGRDDRLLILFDSDRFELIDREELHDINIGGSVRAPLLARFYDRESATAFIFMVNHLYRSKVKRRSEQARMLNDWASDQEVPVIAVGDYNFDWVVNGGEKLHDRGYDLLTANGVFSWIRPQKLIRTQCSRHVVEGMPGCQFDTILDFVFASPEAATWQPTSEIFEHENDFPDTDVTPDHRPVFAQFFLERLTNIAATQGDGLARENEPADENEMLKQELRQRIKLIEDELERIKELLSKLD